MAMTPIDVGRIKILPFEFDSIEELRIDKTLNDHATLYVRGIIRDDYRDSPVKETPHMAAVKCENDGQVYFSGLLQRMKITCVDATYTLEVHAASSTILLDREKHRRSFQDNAQSYKSIVETVIKEKEGSVTFNADELKVENIILQYDETDWEFAKRLASHTGSVLVPAATSEKPCFHFGAPFAGGGEIEARDYSIENDYDAYHRMTQEGFPYAEEDAVRYTVGADDYLYAPGEKVTLNGMELYVSEARLSLINYAVHCFYTLAPKNALSTHKHFNKAIIGLALDGTVLKAEDDHVKLHLHIDKEQDERKAHLFAYATGYSAEGHTGWYVMPEEGDTVHLTFPEQDEKHAYACTSVRQEGTERTSDPLVKFLRTTFGKEIKFNNQEILITGKDDDTFIRVNESTGIEIITSNPISISSGSTVSINSASDMSINSGSNLSITAASSIVMSCGENCITIEPPTGMEITTDKEINVRSEGDFAVESSSEMSLSSEGDMSISTDTELAQSAGTEIKISCSGSSILLDGEIDFKGKKIKEN